MTIEVSSTSTPTHFLSKEEMENPRIKYAVNRYNTTAVIRLNDINGRGQTFADELIAAIRQLSDTRHILIVPIGLPEVHTLTAVQESFYRSRCARFLELS